MGWKVSWIVLAGSCVFLRFSCFLSDSVVVEPGSSEISRFAHLMTVS